MNSNRRCSPCEAAARNRANLPFAMRGLGTTEVQRRQQTYGLIGGLAIVGLWGAAFWWLTR